MKILFVCYANIGRSQVAEEYFKQLTNHVYGFTTCSAGIGVDQLSYQNNEISFKVEDSPYHRSIDYCKEKLHIDISEKLKLQLSIDLCRHADKVIMICEKQLWPSYLYGQDHSFTDKLIHWNIPDTPGLSDEESWKIWDSVMIKTEELVQEII